MKTMFSRNSALTSARASSATATSSRHVESRPPDSIATTGRAPARSSRASRPPVRTASRTSSQITEPYTSWAEATNSSVGSEKPFSLTSPIRTNSSPSDPSAISTTGRVTSTSPPPARATTRAAWLTSRP